MRILTIPLDILQISNKSYNYHLALTGQMAFNVSNFRF